MYTLLVVLHVLVAAGLIGLVLVQHGKGADAGAAFGSGASGTVFGARGSANFLTKTTAWLAAAFFVISLALAYLVHGRAGGNSLVDQLSEPTAPAATTPAPAVPGGENPAAGTLPPVAPATSNAPATAPVVPEAAPATSKPAVPAAGKPDAPKVPD